MNILVFIIITGFVIQALFKLILNTAIEIAKAIYTMLIFTISFFKKN